MRDIDLWGNAPDSFNRAYCSLDPITLGLGALGLAGGAAAGALSGGGSAPTPTPQAPPPMASPQKAPPPKQSTQSTFMGAIPTAPPPSTGQKTLLGQ